MKRIAFIVAFVAMFVILVPFLSNLKEKELCPSSYSFVDGACCLDKEQDQICDEKQKPVLEEPKEIIPKAYEPRKYTVELYNLQFFPDKINISVGDTISWVNKESVTPHQIYERRNLFRSSRLETGDRFDYTFSEKGEYLIRDAVYFKTMTSWVYVHEPPPVITGTVTKLDSRNITAISSVALLLILLVINYFIHKRWKR